MHIASSNDAYRPLAAQWPEADPRARAAMWRATLTTLASGSGGGRVLVAERDRDGVLVGFVHGGPARRTEPGVPDEVYAIHVLPAHRGSGVGTALWRAMRAELGALYVDTLAELECCRFYERHGGEEIERAPRDFHGAERTHVTYRFPARPLSAFADARCARR